MPNVVLFKRGPWNQAETAELNLLTAAAFAYGLRVSPWTGLSDEGDPWYALINPLNHLTIIHVARASRGYVAFGENVLTKCYRTLECVRETFFPAFTPMASQKGR
jgi:hypothetical protein